jgi:hypothetical protein
MNDHLESLKFSCHAREPLSDSQKIAEGESIWVAGVPVPAESGYIGLSMGEHHSFILSESSILEVEKAGDTKLYLVRVKAGAIAIVRAEATMTLTRKHCDCPKPSRTLEEETGGSGGDLGDLAGICDVTCTIGQACSQWTDRNGFVREVCVPFIVCNSPCLST